MKRLLLCSGVYGQSASIDRLRRFVEQRRPEGVLFAGGILSQDRQLAPRTDPWGLALEDEQFVLQFFKALGQLGVFSAVIPAANFQPIDEFCRLAMAGELEFPNVHVVHATLCEEGDLAVSGLGVTTAEQALMRDDCYSRTAAQYFLRALRTSNKPRKVLLLPEPPPGALGGPEGNPLVGELIDGLRPDLCVVAGKTSGAASSESLARWS